MATTTRSDAFKALPPVYAERDARLNRETGIAFLAAGTGSFALALATAAARQDAAVRAFLTRNAGDSPFNGEILVGLVTCLLAWILLHYALRGRQIDLPRTAAAALMLTALALALAAPVGIASL